MAQAIVCGAGAAGLASAASLKRVGVDPAVLERPASVGTSRRRRYADLGQHGLARAPRGIRTTLEERSIGPSIDAGFVNALKTRRIEIVPAVTASTAPTCCLPTRAMSSRRP
jgi:flavin-dependent dehydrogenase